MVHVSTVDVDALGRGAGVLVSGLVIRYLPWCWASYRDRPHVDRRVVDARGRALSFGWSGAGETGLAAATTRQFIAAGPVRTAFFGRVTTVREELAGETGTVLAAWLGAVDLLILDDLDFGWSLTSPGDGGGVLLAQCLRTRFSNDLPALLTAHVPPSALTDDVDPSVRSVLNDSPWSVMAVTEGPSLRTGR